MKDLQAIKRAVDAGKRVHWKNEIYTVIKDGIGQYLIDCARGSCMGLTRRDGVTLSGKPEDFYVAGTRISAQRA